MERGNSSIDRVFMETEGGLGEYVWGVRCVCCVWGCVVSVLRVVCSVCVCVICVVCGVCVGVRCVCCVWGVWGVCFACGM